MSRSRLRCSMCQQFHNEICQLGVPECRGSNSVAAEECACFLPASGIPVFLSFADCLEKVLAFRSKRAEYKRRAFARWIKLREDQQLALF